MNLELFLLFFILEAKVVLALVGARGWREMMSDVGCRVEKDKASDNLGCRTFFSLTAG